MNALHTKNIAFAVILTAYHVGGTTPGLVDPDTLYAANTWDFFGFDTYQTKESGVPYDARYERVVAYAESKHLPYAVGEWGNRGNDASSAQEMVNFFHWGFDNHKDQLAVSYFDSDLNSPDGGWTLTGANLNQFISILKSDPKVARLSNLGSTTSGGGTGGGGTTADKTSPAVSISSPNNNATVSGNLTVSGSASDNVGVSKVQLRVDGQLVTTDSASPYNFVLDTTKYTDGQHTIYLRAYDAADNQGQSATVTVNMANTPSTGGTGGTGSSGGGSGGSSGGSNNGGGTTVIPAGGSSGSSNHSPLPVAGKVVVKPTKPGNKVEVKVDGNPVDSTTVDTNDLTNGTHTLTITENGQTKDVEISVNNSWLRAAYNAAKENPVTYSAGGILAAGLLVALWLLRGRIYGIIWRFRTRNLVGFSRK
jgi:hypothetical protein